MKVNTHSIPVLRAAIAGALSSVALMEVIQDMGPKQMAGAIRNLRNNGLIKGEVDAFKVTAAGTKWLAAYDADAANATAQPTKVEPIKTKATKAAAVDESAGHKRTTKIAKALTLFDRHGGDQEGRRQFVIGKFQSVLGMTAGGASTYFQLCRRERGLAERASA